MIPGVPSMGGAELLIVLAIILLFFGAKRVPELGRSLGKGIREFRQGTAEAINEGKQDQRRDDDSEGEKPSLNSVPHGGQAHTEEVETTSRAEQKS
jgi:sec-independent protein translocase protein TatA